MPTTWLDLPLMVAVILISRLAAPRLPLAVPDTVMQLAGGLLLGPSGLGWLRINAVVTVLAALGMGYLLLTAGMELELRVRRPGQRARALAAQASSMFLALPLTLVVSAAADIGDRAAVAAALLTTLMMPALAVIRANANLREELGEFTIVAGAYGELAAAIVIAVSAMSASRVVSVAILGLLLAGAGALQPLRLKRARHGRRVGTSGAVLGSRLLLPLGMISVCAALAPFLGGEVVLPTLAAGILCSSRHPRASWNAVRTRLDRIGLTALAPLSFVAAGARVHIGAMGVDGRAPLSVAALVLAMVVCRAVPALAFARGANGPRPALASGLLMSTKLTLVVVAVQVGQHAGSLARGSASTLVLAAMLSVAVFPTVADKLARLRPAVKRRGSDASTVGQCSVRRDAAFSDA
jgi:Kef-type K+ transport system membrane component KefB